MIKIEIPLKRKPNSGQRRMAGSKMMRNAIIDRHQKVVDTSKLKVIIVKLIKDNTEILEIHKSEPNNSSLMLSINLNENSPEYNAREIISVVSRKYVRFKFRSFWIK